MPPARISGFYGKLPWAGDFVQRRLPPELVLAWDTHLIALLPTLPRLSTCSGRPWAFLCAPHTCGPAAFAGMVAPGVDRVGRHFPLLLACPVRADAEGGGLLRAGLPWFDAAARLLAGVSAGAVKDMDTFDACVAGLNDSDDITVPGALADELPPALRNGWARCLADGGSLWWRDAAAAACLLPGLPDARHCLRGWPSHHNLEVDA